MKLLCFTAIALLFSSNILAQKKQHETIKIYSDSVLNHLTNKPIGINMNYFMDDDHYLKPKITTTDALKNMGVKYLRYPGGNKSDFYFFSKPPYQKSEPTLARTGKGAVGGRVTTLNKTFNGFAEDPLDFDEFMSLCKKIGAEPVIVVAADEYLKKYPVGSTWSSRDQLIAHAKEWVRYANIKKKYGIKYWMIGNESWHESNPNSSAEIYAHDVIDFSKAMKAIDPNILIIPNGNNQAWWDTLFTKAAGAFDAVCISNYPINNYSNGYKTYQDTTQSMVNDVVVAKNAIAKYIAAGQQNNFKIIVAEYGPFDWTNKWPHINNMGLAMANFEILGQQLLEPKIDFSCFWNTRWINNAIKNDAYDALDRNGNINAIGMSLSIWANNLGDKMIKTTNTTFLKTFASIDEKKQQLYIYIVNKSKQNTTLLPSIFGLKKFSCLNIFSLQAKNVEEVHPVWKKIENQLNEESAIQLSGNSISVITYDIKN